MFTKFWARSAKWGQNGGLKSVPDACIFLLAIPDDFSATSQQPIFAKFGHNRWIVGETQNLDRNSWKVSIQGLFAHKTPNFERVKQVPHSEWATGQGYTAEILFIMPPPRRSKVKVGRGAYCGGDLAAQLVPRCSPRTREFPISGQLFCTTYGCGATGLQSCPIFGFWPIFPTQNP